MAAAMTTNGADNRNRRSGYNMMATSVKTVERLATSGKEIGPIVETIDWITSS